MKVNLHNSVAFTICTGKGEVTISHLFVQVCEMPLLSFLGSSSPSDMGHCRSNSTLSSDVSSMGVECRREDKLMKFIVSEDEGTPGPSRVGDKGERGMELAAAGTTASSA
jgi:hypothetical protein